MGTGSTTSAFFADVLPKALRRRGALARRLGGRIGLLVDGDEWLIDLDHGVVAGGGLHRAVEEADHLDVVVSVSGENLKAALESGAALSPKLVRGDPAALASLAEVLAATRRT